MGTAVVLSDAGLELPRLSVHIRMLEMLELRPCHSFLDVHSSTGFLTCLGAYLVGRCGRAVGLAVGGVEAAVHLFVCKSSKRLDIQRTMAPVSVRQCNQLVHEVLSVPTL